MQQNSPFCLLDRLTDNDPSSASDAPLSRAQHREQTKRSVIRDLEWLLNAETSRDLPTDLSGSVCTLSTLDFGLPPLSGRTASELDVHSLELEIARRIQFFEPRINPQTLRVQAEQEVSLLNRHNVIGFHIHAQLMYTPSPIELTLRTQIDLESGQVHMTPLLG